jgi:hypothetical protein
MGERRSSYRVLVGNLSERGHLEGLGEDGRTILKSIFKTGLIWLRIGTGGGLL